MKSECGVKLNLTSQEFNCKSSNLLISHSRQSVSILLPPSNAFFFFSNYWTRLCLCHLPISFLLLISVLVDRPVQAEEAVIAHCFIILQLFA